MHQAGQVAGAFAAAGPDGLLQAVQDQRGRHRGGGAPAQDPAGEHAGHERHVDHPRPGRAVGEVGHPQLVRPGRGEMPVHQVSGPGRGRVRPGGPRRPGAAGQAGDAHLAHQPLDGAPGHVMALRPQPHLAGTQPGHVPLARPLGSDRRDQLLITQLPPRRAPGDSLVERRRGDRAAVLSQHPADRLDPELTAMLSDVVD